MRLNPRHRNWLEDGHIVEEGHPVELLRDPDTRFAAWVENRRHHHCGNPLEVRA